MAHLSNRAALAANLAFPACFLLVACASGGGGRLPVDSGTRPVDSAMPDGFVAPTDSGITLMDSSVADSGVADSGTADSGTADTGRPDTGPAPDCTVDSDCDDGLACTGTETCVGGSCVGGTAVACGDAVPCTTDTCTEPAGSCTHAPSDALCAAGEACDVSLGCQSTSTCAESPCRLVSPQCGCAAGEGCYLSGGTRVCVTAGTTAVGARCDTTQCTPGAICVNIAATGTATAMCHRNCTTDANCPGTGALCIGGIMGSTDKTCTVDCDPATQVGCPTGTGCSFFTESAGAMRTLTDCSAPVGTGGQNSSCTTDANCQRGYACITTVGTAKECLHWCRRPGGSECGFGASCFGFDTPIIWNSIEYGVCN